MTVSVDVTNTGSIAGDEIVQVYLAGGQVPSYAKIAKKQLAAFQRTEQIQPGETRTVTMEIDPRNFCYWDTKASVAESSWGTKGKWSPVAGPREILVGGSSDCLLSAGTMTFDTN